MTQMKVPTVIEVQECVCVGGGGGGVSTAGIHLHVQIIKKPKQDLLKTKFILFSPVPT